MENTVLLEEVWRIGEEIETVFGRDGLRFWRKSGGIGFTYHGEWQSNFPESAALRSAVESTWTNLRTAPADDELKRRDGKNVKILEVGTLDIDPYVLVDEPIGKKTIIFIFDRRLRTSLTNFSEQQIARAQEYWIANHDWKEDEYLDRSTGLLQKLQDSEVRRKDGNKVSAHLFTSPLDEAQERRLVGILASHLLHVEEGAK